MKEDKMKKEAVLLKNATGVEFPELTVLKCLTLETIENFVGFGDDTNKKYPNRFYFKNSIDDRFLTSDQLKALTVQTKTVDKKVTKKTAKTESKEVTEQRVTFNDILEKCESYKDCFEATLKALKKVGANEYNALNLVDSINRLDHFDKKVENMINAMIKDLSIFKSPVKNKRAVFTATETFNKEEIELF